MGISSSELQRSAPVSEQIQQILRERIRNGHYPPKSRIPSEESLAREFAVSRASVRTALAGLIAEGLLYRNRGVGTFPNPVRPRLETGLDRLESVLSMAARQSLPTQVGHLTVETTEATNVLAKRLQVPPGTALTSVRRTIVVDSKPVSYQEDFVLPQWLACEQVDESFRGSVLDLLLKQEDLHITEAVGEIEAVAADPRLASLLEIPNYSPLLLMSVVVYETDGTAVMSADNYYVPGEFRFNVTSR